MSSSLLCRVLQLLAVQCFRGFRVVKYDPRNPDPGPLDLGENVLIGVPFQIVKFQAGVFPFGQQDILDKHDLTDLVKVEDGLKPHRQLDLDLVAPEEGRRSHGLVVGGEDHRSAAVLLVRLVLAVNPPVTPDTKYFLQERDHMENTLLGTQNYTS